MLKMGLVGGGISKAKMPKLQMFLGDLVGIPIDYQLIDSQTISDFEAIKEITQRRAQGYHGVNVTHPYKQTVISIVDKPLSVEHGAIGSYNTLRFFDDHILGANTDYSGFIRGYRHRRGELAPGNVLMCGAGGVGRAVGFALAKLGATEIAIFDLNTEQADKLAASLVARGANAIVITQQQLPEKIAQADGLINCTALGMFSYPGTAFERQFIAQQSWAFDAVYTPLKTQFILDCEAKGIACMSGFDLWIFQGLDAFEIFTGKNIAATEDILATTLGWVR